LKFDSLKLERPLGAGGWPFESPHNT
jgi:hypothetical protein